MKIAVIGAGAMGSLFGGKLSSVASVWLIDPWKEHIKAIQRHGLRLIEPEGEQVIRVKATTDPATVKERVDLALILVKSPHTEAAARTARSLLKEDGLVLTLQNGLGNLEVIARVVGAERAVQGVTAHGATLLGPGRVRHAGHGPTHLATRPEVEERMDQVADTFRRAGFETHLSADLEGLLWGKLIINVGINALTAILRVPNGALAEIDEARALMEEAVEEAVRVARAKGIGLPYDNPQRRVREVCLATAENLSSMLQDVLRRRPTEIEVINGAIVREAARFGIPTPVNRLLVQLVKAIEASYKMTNSQIGGER